MLYRRAVKDLSCGPDMTHGAILRSLQGSQRLGIWEQGTLKLISYSALLGSPAPVQGSKCVPALE